MITRLALAAVGGYAAGLLPSADLVARFCGSGVDVRRSGSGNPGAANTAAVLGHRAGAAVFALDMGKGHATGRIAATLAGPAVGPIAANVASAAAVLGHCYPPGRSGGKGVATSFGQMLATFPAYLPVDLVLGAVAARSDFWKPRPVATVGATCGLWVGLATAWHRWRLPNLWAGPAVAATPVAAAISGAAIVHRFAVEARSNDDSAAPDNTGDSQ